MAEGIAVGNYEWPACREGSHPGAREELNGEQRFLHCGGQGTAAVAAELGVDFLQSVNEIADLAPCVRPAGGGAKVGAAAERAIFVNEAAALRIE